MTKEQSIKKKLKILYCEKCGEFLGDNIQNIIGDALKAAREDTLEEVVEMVAIMRQVRLEVSHGICNNHLDDQKWFQDWKELKE